MNELGSPLRAGTEAICKNCGDQVYVPAGEDPNDTLCVGCADDRDSGNEDIEDVDAIADRHGLSHKALHEALRQSHPDASVNEVIWRAAQIDGEDVR